MREPQSASYRCLSSSALKLIAIVTMLIDHSGYAIVYYLPHWNQYYDLCRGIGRISFPIFCFLLVEGFLHTSNRKKYGVRLFLFAWISELPYDLVFNANQDIWSSQNVFFTLFLGLMLLWGMEYFYGRMWIQAVLFALCMGIAYLINCDYDWKGVLLIVVLYLCRYDTFTRTVAGMACVLWEWKAIFAFLPINLYNGKRGCLAGKYRKYIFYWFYPVHLLILACIRYHWFVAALPFFT